VKHLIIEGCDGSGKTTLIDQLMQTKQFVKHARASTSLGGPVDSLSDWVDDDLHRLGNWTQVGRPPFIYDRHPLISELIYADLRKIKRGLTGKFTDVKWIIQAQRQMADHAILVICDPAYAEVERTLQEGGRDSHMPGVFENRYTIFNRYRAFTWPGTVVRYDWTLNTPKNLIETIQKLDGN